MASERLLEDILQKRESEKGDRKKTQRENLKNLLSQLATPGKQQSSNENKITYGTFFQPRVRRTSIPQGDHLTPPNDLPSAFNPRLESIVIKMAENEDISRIIEKLGQDWAAESVNYKQNLDDYDLLPLVDISVTQAWNIIHELRADKRIALAEPSWEIDIIAEETRPPAPDNYSSINDHKSDHAANNKFWAPELIHIQQAWNLALPDGGKVHGEGIRIAHPDTGYSHHHRYGEGSRAMDVDAGFDFVGIDATTNLESSIPGIGTVSVSMSGTEGDILGVAPKATLIPMRVAQKGLFARPAPLLLRAGMKRLRKAIETAINTDCHVISISHGWLGHKALKDVIQRAWRQNIIVIAAAGNYSGSFIAAPAKYRESICIAGCDSERGIWEGSARGSRVDCCAPAQDVWKAGYFDHHAIPMQSSGTSFAAALTAGVAALWLAYHGREKLIALYEPAGVPLAEVFRIILKQSADPSPKQGFGGIINAEKALNMPLPDPREVLRSFEWETLNSNLSDTNSPSLATTLELLGDDYQLGRQQLVKCLDVPEDRLERIAMNCGDELAFHTLLALARKGSAFQNSERNTKLEISQMSDRLKGQITGYLKNDGTILQQ